MLNFFHINTKDLNAITNGEMPNTTFFSMHLKKTPYNVIYLTQLDYVNQLNSLDAKNYVSLNNAEKRLIRIHFVGTGMAKNFYT